MNILSTYPRVEILMTQRLRLYDKYFNVFWDSETATTPAYQHISQNTHATIDYPTGHRKLFIMDRVAEGVKRAEYDPIWLEYLLIWPELPDMERISHEN